MIKSEAFKLESEMLPFACQGLPPAIGMNGPEWCSLTEPMIGNVFPDLLFGRLTTIQINAPTFTHVEASILSLVHNELDFTVADVLSRIFLPTPTADRTFRTLEKKGALERTPTGAFRVCSNLPAAQMEIVAVELKLKRWREACTQAASYLSFADRAYAVLDGNQLKVTETIVSAFRSAGVGLVLQRGSVFDVVVESTTARQMTPNRVVAAQKLARHALA